MCINYLFWSNFEIQIRSSTSFNFSLFLKAEFFFRFLPFSKFFLWLYFERSGFAHNASNKSCNFYFPERLSQRGSTSELINITKVARR